MSISKNTAHGGWRGASAAKATGCPFRGLSTYIRQLTTSVTLAPGDGCPLLASVDTRHACRAQTYMQAEHAYT